MIVGTPISAGYEFYSQDCISFGLMPRFPTKDIPNFNEKEPSTSSNQLSLSGLKFKVANIANYFKNEGKLVEHLNEVNFIIK